MTGPTEVLLDFLPRIEAAARELADAHELVAAATRRRNELIIAAADAGVSQREIAKAAHIGHPRVIAILSTPLDTNDDAGEGRTS